MIEILLTFVWIRLVGAVVRRRMPRLAIQRRSTAHDVLIDAAPTFGIGLVVLAAGMLKPVMLMSTAGALVSLAGDVVGVIVGLGTYRYALHSIRKSPNKTARLIVCAERTSRWPARWFGWWIPLAEPMLVAPNDFIVGLNGDSRFLDRVHLRPAAIRKLRALGEHRAARINGNKNSTPPWMAESWPPHFPLIATGGVSDDLTVNAPDQTLTSSLNRALNFRLTHTDWQTSLALSERLPDPVASSWRAFHHQQTTRTRLASLFNTVDQLQRLCAIAAISSLRANALPLEMSSSSGEFSSSFGTWNNALERALATPGLSLSQLRYALLVDAVEPEALSEVLRIYRAGTTNHDVYISARDAFRILGDARNALFGHGMVAWTAVLRPIEVVGALHRFLLAACRSIARVEIVLDPGSSSGAGPVLAIAGEIVPISPYGRIEDGQLLLVNRIRTSEAEYVNYRANCMEPSYTIAPVPNTAFEHLLSLHQPPAARRS